MAEVSLVDSVICLAHAEQMLEEAITGELPDGEPLSPERAALVRAAWTAARDVWAGTGASDLAVGESAAFLLGQVALLGDVPGLDADALDVAAGALRHVVDAGPSPEGRNRSLALLGTVIEALAEREPDDGRTNPGSDDHMRRGGSRADLLEEALGRFIELRDLSEDSEDWVDLTDEIAGLAYRVHVLRDRADPRLLDLAVTELTTMSEGLGLSPEGVMALADLHEDRWLRTHDEADRRSAIRLLTDLLAEPELPADTSSAARGLRGHLALADPMDPAGVDLAFADLTFVLDSSVAEDPDGPAAAIDLAEALLRLHLRHDDDAVLAVRCLDVLEAAQGPDAPEPADLAELVVALGTEVLRRAHYGGRWSEAYLPALRAIVRYADRDGGADPVLVALAGIGAALRASHVFMAESRSAAEPLLVEALDRLDAALQLSGLAEIANDLHALSLAVLGLLVTPTDWAPTSSFAEALQPDRPLSAADRNRDLARKALWHWEQLEVTAAAAFPPMIIVLMKRLADPGAHLSDEDVALLRRPQPAPSDVLAAMASDAVRGGLLAEDADRREDVGLLQEAVDLLRHGLRDLDPLSPMVPRLRLVLAGSLGRLACRTGDAESLPEAFDHVGAAHRAGIGELEEQADQVRATLLAVGRRLAESPDGPGVRAPVPARPGGEHGGTAGVGIEQSLPADLEEEARDLRRAGDPGAHARARAALRAYGRAVLVASAGAALAIAARANAWAVVAAEWAVRDGRPDTAVEVLEHGRGLLLSAATSTGDGAAILRASARADLADLADRWQRGVLDPSLQHEVIAALLDTPAGAFVAGAPDPYAIGAALFELGRDALVYLMTTGDADDGCDDACGHGWHGRAFVVRPGGAVVMLPLRARSGPPPDDAADPAAYEALADWADEAAGAALRAHVAGWELPHDPRLVLVPLGELSAVPWAAARRWTDRGPRYLVQDLCLSYAASARQVIAASRRPVLARDTAVIVANPGGNLPYAARAAAVVRDRFHPQARCAGLPRNRLGPRPGGPDDVLAALGLPTGSPVGITHLSAHAVLDVEPERSRVVLAGGASLAVAELLAYARQRSPDAAGGLVVLGCCVTDRSGRLPDEALTLATAFLAAGAAGVIGTRRTVADGTAAVLSVVLHRHLSDRTCPPAEALRRTQLWMLDPGRTLPEGLPSALVDAAAGADLADPGHWASWTHHGR